MISERPDWCISRQRSWGVPIPAFYCLDCKQELIDVKTIDHVRGRFDKEGADTWFYKDVSHFLPPDTKCSKCGGARFERKWISLTSGLNLALATIQFYISATNCRIQPTCIWRGQTSTADGFSSHCFHLLEHGHGAFKSVLTHGFVVDEKGEKMSKSLGNFISVEDALKEFGADVIRLWTSSLDYQNDMSVSRNLILRCADAYRRIRNTFRYLLSNLLTSIQR